LMYTAHVTLRHSNLKQPVCAAKFDTWCI
jgi:hypothetical protein